MQNVICKVGGDPRLDDNARIVIHSRNWEMGMLGDTVTAGITPIFGGAWMDVVDCSIGEKLSFGDDIRVRLTGRIDGVPHDCIDTC